MCNRIGYNMQFDGETFVAFSDLSGFKYYMKDRDRAFQALNTLYNSAYSILQAHQDISALAVSDCVVAWARNQQIDSIIEFTSKLHKLMIEQKYFIKTTIAWGKFEYRNRLQLSNMQKGMILGGAYLTAYLNNRYIPEGSIVLLQEGRRENRKPAYRHTFWRRNQTPKGWEYFWSVSNQKQIPIITKERKKMVTFKYSRLKRIYSQFS
ncbi:hypothetical protein KAR91_51660 [Candidatus Pacearchaeota archaeon]|nr:hypothetical protein [Candidatus Pacearchaeota archaeon]